MTIDEEDGTPLGAEDEGGMGGGEKGVALTGV